MPTQPWDSDKIIAEEFAMIKGVVKDDITPALRYTIRSVEEWEYEMVWVGVEFMPPRDSLPSNIVVQSDRGSFYLEGPTWGELRMMCKMLDITIPAF